MNALASELIVPKDAPVAYLVAANLRGMVAVIMNTLRISDSGG
jgi:hypothetical protein